MLMLGGLGACSQDILKVDESESQKKQENTQCTEILPTSVLANSLTLHSAFVQFQIYVVQTGL